MWQRRPLIPAFAHRQRNFFRAGGKIYTLLRDRYLNWRGSHGGKRLRRNVREHARDRLDVKKRALYKDQYYH
jgi:hypothetical protein